MVRRAQTQHQGAFKLGDLMCISVAKNGITTSLRLSDYSRKVEEADFWLYEEDILIGVVVEERQEYLKHTKSYITEYRILSPLGIFWFSLSWSSADDLCIQLLTDEVGEYIMTNARWHEEKGVWVWNDRRSRFP